MSFPRLTLSLHYGNKIDWSRTDGLIFDMDGTLWDAVDTYARIWNEVFLRAGKEVHITRESLIGNIGIPIPKILANLFPEIETKRQTVSQKS